MTADFPLDYRFSVESAADAHRMQALYNLMGNSALPLGLNIQGGTKYSGHFQARMFGDVGLRKYQFDSPQNSNIVFVGERTRSHIARNRFSGFQIAIWYNGESKMNAGGKPFAMQAGDFTIMDTEQPFCIHMPKRCHVCSLSLPASWDRIGDNRLKNVAGNLYSGLDRRSQGLSNYALQLLAHPGLTDISDVPKSLYDVIALALNPRAKSEHQTGLLALIHNYIGTHFANPSLDPGNVAAAFDITPRHLHRLFAASGASFGEYLIELRLTQAQRLLADPRYQHQKILSIAFACGFINIGHFGNRFRERFGIAPGEFRHTHQGNFEDAGSRDNQPPVIR